LVSLMAFVLAGVEKPDLRNASPPPSGLYGSVR
jgi:hypothetical protein